MTTRLLGWILVLAAAVLAIAAIYLSSTKSEVPIVFSPTQMLNSTWNAYKQAYVEQNTGRTIDKQRDNITTSEGESYTMLRAVWLADKTTFDQSWNWTQGHLVHPDDHLFSWLWGKKDDGSWGVLTSKGGSTTASDADQDIALSLLFAYHRWNDLQYLSAAKNIISDIWDKEVVIVNSTPYLSADNLEASSTNPTIAIDPSYLSPAAYKIFATVDTTHPWSTLVTSSYTLLLKSENSLLDKTKSVGLPPDWIAMDRKSGAITAIGNSTNTTNFSFDALRIPWRLALDWQWFSDPRAKNMLESFSFLKNEWQKSGQLATTVAHDGSVGNGQEAPAMYGGTIGYFVVADPVLAQTIYENKLLYLYDPGKNSWKDTLSYYDDNWAWFGIALYNNLLPNLTQ